MYPIDQDVEDAVGWGISLPQTFDREVASCWGLVRSITKVPLRGYDFTLERAEGRYQVVEDEVALELLLSLLP